ncbi:hypothetical protein E9840_11215 [Tissierella creatinini]|nr:hypothetical protein E9840_11215 [Tissierella creatinini]TJX62904.1 hypothetical protein E8P77_16270 [Soehngenia saccharolytica]
MKVTEQLYQIHSIEAIAGKKGICPNCGEKKFSIKRDDSIGKCFNLQCGYKIIESRSYEIMINSIYAILDVLCQKSNTKLLDSKESAAYRYLTEERDINPRVVAESMIGIVANGYGIDDNINFALVRLNELKNSAKDSKEISLIDTQINLINHIRPKLIRLLEDKVGWVILYLTDKNLRISTIKFRKPFSKEFAVLKINDENPGVFGYSLFALNEDRSGDFLVTEGEFNSLALQSLIATLNPSLEELPYARVISVGSAVSPDFKTVKGICEMPVFIKDNDKAGELMINNAKDSFHGYSVTTEPPAKDLDDLISSYGKNYVGAEEAVKNLVERKERFYRNYGPLEEDITTLRRTKYKEFFINQEVFKIILEDLKLRGSFFNDASSGYFFNDETKVLSMIDKEDFSLKLLLSKYKLIQTEGITHYVISNLHLYAMEHGLKTKIHRFCYYSKENNTLYLSNNSNMIYKIDKESIELTPNGTHGILFLTNPNYESFEIANIKPETSFIDKYIIDQANLDEDTLSVEDRKYLLKMYIYSLFFESLSPTKILVYFVGPMGSGKSALARKIGLLLYGSKFNVTPISSASDFDVAVTNSDFVCLDNLDTKNQEWVEDRLAIVASGGKLLKRELYTTNNMVQIELKAFVTLTAHIPQIRRSDLVDRMLIYRMKRLETFKPENLIKQEIIDNRNNMLTEIAFGIQRILSSFEELGDTHYETSIRMGDFIDFAYKASHAIGDKELLESIVEKLGKMQTDFALENDPIIDFIDTWLSRRSNVGRYVTTKELYNELKDIAIQEEGSFLLKNNRSLAQKLRNLNSSLKNYFIISEREEGARTRKIAFWPLTDNVEEPASSANKNILFD